MTASTSSSSSEHTGFSGTMSIGFDFFGYIGPQVQITAIEFYNVEIRPLNLLDVGSAAGEQIAWGNDLGQVVQPNIQPQQTLNLPQGFTQIKPPENP